MADKKSGYLGGSTLIQYKEMVVVHRNHPRLVLEQLGIGLRTSEFIKTPEWELVLGGEYVYPKNRIPLMLAVAPYFYDFESMVKEILSTATPYLSSSMQGFALLWAYRWGLLVGGSEENVNRYHQLKAELVTDMYFEVLRGYAKLKFTLQGKEDKYVDNNWFTGGQLQEFLRGFKVYRDK